MKYIRTKEGIFKFVDFLEIQDGIFKFVDFVEKEDVLCRNHYGYRDKNGIAFLGTLADFKEDKIASTIEELCDEFALTNNGDIPLVIHNVVELDSGIFEDVKTLKTQYKVIYGAIWTNKGLFYVAKMNDKGELELL